VAVIGLKGLLATCISDPLAVPLLQWGSTHVSEMLAVGAAGGCTITAAMYARGRQRALDQA
jgi:hypothetical protein